MPQENRSCLLTQGFSNRYYYKTMAKFACPPISADEQKVLLFPIRQFLVQRDVLRALCIRIRGVGTLFEFWL
jgi:hypothetical protein